MFRERGSIISNNIIAVTLNSLSRSLSLSLYIYI